MLIRIVCLLFIKAINKLGIIEAPAVIKATNTVSDIMSPHFLR